MKRNQPKNDWVAAVAAEVTMLKALGAYIGAVIEMEQVLANLDPETRAAVLRMQATPGADQDAAAKETPVKSSHYKLQKHNASALHPCARTEHSDGCGYSRVRKRGLNPPLSQRKCEQHAKCRPGGKPGPITHRNRTKETP